MTEINYNLSDSKTLEDTVDNVAEYLKKDFSQFNLNDLFTIRDNSEPKSKPTKKFYININDYAAVQYAVREIRDYFCIRTPDSKILERLNLQVGQRPVYVNLLWKIAFAFPFITPEGQIAEGEGQATIPTQSYSRFKKQFKEIYFAGVEPLERNTFNRNITHLDKFITETLNLISPNVVIRSTYALLDSCIRLASKMHGMTWKEDPEENKLQSLMDIFTSMIRDFFNMLIKNCKDINGENPFKDIVMSTEQVKSKMTTTERLWRKFTSNPFPEHLTDKSLFHNSAEDLTISLKIEGQERFCLLGAELKRSTLSRNMIPGDNFKNLAGVFRESMGYILSNRYSCYILSDVQRTLYFELPVEDGTWESISDNEVKLIKKNLRYMIIDHTTPKGEGDLTLQTMMALKIFDGLKRYTDDGLCGVGANTRNLRCHRMDRVKESDGYNKFMESFIKQGFKTKSGSNQKKGSSLGKPPDNANKDSSVDDSHNPHCNEFELGSKRRPSQSLQSSTPKKSTLQGTDESSDEIGDIYPADVQFSPREYNVLERYSNTTSTKFYLSVEECLEVFNLRYKMNLDQKRIFVKLFDIYWIQTLHARVYGGDVSESVFEGKLNQSDSNVMNLLKYDEDLERWKYVEPIIKLTYLSELIALKRIESWNRSHPGEQINTAKLLQHGWLILDFPELRTYGGPFLAFENLDFIHRNELDKTPKRRQSFKHQKRLLSRAGIKHNDLKSSNYCFDYNDECFIIDFGNSVVDHDEISLKYELSDLSSPD